MNRPKSRADDADDTGEEAMLEAELARLQRSYRVMQNDYRAYKEETKRIINKQSMLIASLEEEQTELDTCLSKMETTQNKGKDQYHREKLKELASAEKMYEALVKEERAKTKDLQQQIDEKEKMISEQCKKMGGMHNCTAKYIASQKKKAVLENRLDKAMVHFNKQLASNRKLREDIDHLRQERRVFDNLYRKLAKELDNCKTEMSDVIRSSTQAYEQRDEAQNKLHALKERNEKDQMQHESEMKDLMRTIRHDNKVKEFMTIKNNDRLELKAEEAAKKMKKGDGNKGPHADKEAIKNYEAVFRRIKEATGEEDLNVIVEHFIKREEENFALFNYVNELNNEIEGLQDQVGLVKKDIEQFEQEDTQMDNRRWEIMKQLEVKYEAANAEKEQWEKKLIEINKTLDALKSRVMQVFKMIGCNPKPILEMLGGDGGITEKNIMMHLGIIEQKTNEMLSVLQYLQKQRSELEGSLPPAQAATQGSKQPSGLQIAIVPPTAIEEEDSDEDEEFELRPLTEEELRERVVRHMHRKVIGTNAPGTGKDRSMTKKRQQLAKT